MKKYQALRKKYPRFIYKDYSYKIRGGNLKISFFFEIPPDIRFRPQITIKDVSRTFLVTRNVLDNIVFHLGLMEIPSYWKATCSPEIIIESGSLRGEQINWWRDLMIKGMGQFFYENEIDFRAPHFLKIKTKNETGSDPVSTPLKNGYLVPVGGGKDSIVTLEKLKKRGKKVVCFMVNPTKAALAVHRTFYGLNKPIIEPIIVARKIDPKLLELNKKGYLNGHTPFTGLLSFLAVFCAALFGYKNIVFSNEKSANEGNVKYLGKIINHQWSKSSEFEKKFKTYCQKYLIKNLNYFSYLRKYTELEIAKMFARYPKYFSIFSSCNRVVAKALRRRWCGNCPKCLFVYATLYPYLNRKELLKVFGKDLFENKKLLPIMKSLIGQGGPKPFECVGTYKESKLAFNLSLKKAKKLGRVPYLLTKINDSRF